MSDDGTAGDVPDGVASWVERSAAEAGLSPSAFLQALGRELAAAQDGVADADRVGALEADLEEKITDVRERVLQVKREADAKAPADHDHADLQRDLVAANRAVEELEAELSTLRSDLDTTRRTVDEGFDNFEEVLDYLTETTDDLERKTRTLAGAVLDVREGLHTIAANTDPVDELARTANRRGVREAACGDCGVTIDVALLTEAACPHCGATFADVEPAGGLFGWGTATLVTGEQPPAIEPADEVLDEDSDVAAIAGDGGDRS